MPQPYKAFRPRSNDPRLPPPSHWRLTAPLLQRVLAARRRLLVDIGFCLVTSSTRRLHLHIWSIVRRLCHPLTPTKTSARPALESPSLRPVIRGPVLQSADAHCLLTSLHQRERFAHASLCRRPRKYSLCQRCRTYLWHLHSHPCHVLRPILYSLATPNLEPLRFQSRPTRRQELAVL